MKNILYHFMSLAAVVFCTAACRMAPSEDNPAPESQIVSFTALSTNTRAAFLEPDGDRYPAVWQAGDQVKLLVNNSEINSSADKGIAALSLSEDGKKASFSVSIPDPGDVESLNFSVFSPASAYAGRGSATGSTLLTIPTEQSASALSPDPRAMLLSAFSGPYGSVPEQIGLHFSHLTAYGRIILTGLPEGETLQSVTLHSDRTLAGLFDADAVSGTLSVVEGADRITIACRDAEAVWFACAPCDWSASTLELTAVTSGGSYTVTRSFPAEREMKAGRIAGITVDMSGASGKTDVFDENHIVFSFGAISDVHINSTTNAYAQKFTGALNQLKTRASVKDADGLDAVVVAGDLTDTPSQAYAQTGYFKTLYEKVLDPKTVPMIYTVGNHDANTGYRWNPNTIIQAAVMSQVLGDDYFLTDQDQTMRTGFECRHNLVAGYHILSITPTGMNPVTYPAESKAWLDATLQELTAADPERYIFINTHPMIENTVYGSLLGTATGTALSNIWHSDSGDYWATHDLTDILAKYPQVVTFGGHLHFPIHDPRSIWQGDFTAFGCGSVRYMAIENGGYEDMKSATVMNDCEQVSDGWLIQLDVNGNLRATALDFLGNAVIGTPYEIPYPRADKSHLGRFGNGRASVNQAPVIDPSQFRAVTCKVGICSTTDIEWAKATDDEFVHHYYLVLRKNGSYVNSWKFLADFYLHPHPSGMKDVWTLALGTLPAGNYECVLTAYDSWDASDTCTLTFTVEETQSSDPEVFADIDFTGGAITDTKARLSIDNRGAAVASTSVSHGGNTYTVPALKASASRNVRCQFKDLTTSEVASGFFRCGFSVEAMFVDRSPGSSIHGVVCGTQAGGWGLAMRANGTPYFIVGEDSYNTYKSVDAASVISTSELTHVVCVYDPSAQKMSIYLNGALSRSQSISGLFYLGAEDTYNRFCLGADIAPNDKATDFNCTDMVITDAKFYTGALDATAVQAAYQAAVQALNQ